MWNNISEIPLDLIKEKREEIKCNKCQKKSLIMYCFNCKEWHCRCKHVCAMCNIRLKSKNWKFNQCQCGFFVCNNCFNFCNTCNKKTCDSCLKFKDKCKSCAYNYCDCNYYISESSYKKCNVCKHKICIKCSSIFLNRYEKYYCKSCVKNILENVNIHDRLSAE
jgi:hypothetical protein